MQCRSKARLGLGREGACLLRRIRTGFFGTLEQGQRIAGEEDGGWRGRRSQERDGRLRGTAESPHSLVDGLGCAECESRERGKGAEIAREVGRKMGKMEGARGWEWEWEWEAGLVVIGRGRIGRVRDALGRIERVESQNGRMEWTAVSDIADPVVAGHGTRFGSRQGREEERRGRSRQGDRCDERSDAGLGKQERERASERGQRGGAGGAWLMGAQTRTTCEYQAQARTRTTAKG